MNWFKTCLKNKLLIYICAVAVCVAGLYAIYLAPLSPFPLGTPGNISIDISYPGANATTISEQILKSLEPDLQTISHIKNMRSTTQAGQAHIQLTLEDHLSDNARLQTEMQVIQTVSSANLPAAVPTPSIRLTGGGVLSLIAFAVTSKTASVFDMGNFVQSVLQPKFSAIPGVTVFTTGENPIINIALNPTKVARYNLNPSDIVTTINNNTQFNPLGDYFIKQQDYPLNMQNSVTSLYDFRHMLINYSQPTNQNTSTTTNFFQGMPIYLQNLGKVSFSPAPSAYFPYGNFNGDQDAEINLVTLTNANPFTVSKITRDFVNSIQPNLPMGMHITPVDDISTLLLNSIKEVALTIAIACVLVFLVALVFLGRLRSTVISIVTIPICLLGASVFIYLFGYTINILTLLAMVIAVGLVVDDAIVVVENITRYIEMGYKRYDAVIEGTSTIAVTIIGITLTLLAVYLPLTFIQSQIVSMIKPFAVTLASAVFISGIVALTVTPVVSYALISDQKENRYQQWFHHIFSRIIAAYHIILKGVLKFSKSSLAVIIVLLAIGAFFASKLPAMVFPHDPEGNIRIQVSSTPSDTVQTIKKTLEQFAPFYKSNAVEYYSMTIQPNPFTNTHLLSGRLNIEYKDDYLKKLNPIVDKINAYIKQHHITNTMAKSQDGFSEGGDFDVSFYLYGNGSLEKVNRDSQALAKSMTKSGVFATASASVQPSKKQIAFSIDEAKALSIGITRTDITQLLSMYFGGSRLRNDFSIDGLTVPVRVDIDAPDRQNPKSLSKIMIQSPLTHQSYPLNEFVSQKLIAAPTLIERFNGNPTVEIDANLAKGHALGEAIKAINKLKDTIAPQSEIYYIDAAQTYLQGSSQTIWVAILGLACIYFLLTLLFRNLIDPFIILLTVPCTVIGGALSLYLIGGNFNIYSTLGLITLIGLISKHGILIVRFANDELSRGKAVYEAILEATKHRFRPIIMTTLAMVFGALPLLVSSKALFVSRENLAIVIMGGLIIGTLFSLIIIPLVYTLIKKAEHVN
jgi:hydrophobe/amphiphile efflux-1 (HAE1) family protein